MIDYKIKTFIIVAQVSSFSKAAEILHITQPAVSQHISSIENYFKCELFDKRKRTIKLTEEGELLYKYAIEMSRINDIVKDKIINSMSVVKKYKIGATMTIGSYIVPEILGEYKKIHPNIDINLYVNNTYEVFERLKRGKIILGLVEGPFDRSKYKYTKFKDDSLILVVSPEHPFAKRESVKVEEVLNDNLIVREKGSGTRMVLEKKLLLNGYKLDEKTVYMEIGNINAIISLVKLNLGCTIISREGIDDLLKDGTLIEIPIEHLNLNRTFDFVYIEDDDPFIKAFIEFCKKYSVRKNIQQV